MHIRLIGFLFPLRGCRSQWYFSISIGNMIEFTRQVSVPLLHLSCYGPGHIHQGSPPATFFFFALFGLLLLFGLLDYDVDSLPFDCDESRPFSYPYSSRILSLKFTRVLMGTFSLADSSAKMA